MEKHNILDVCDIYQPKTISTKEFIPDGEYSVYGANGIIGRYNFYNHENSEVLMACRGATCGTINISRPYSWINGNAMVIHPNGKFPIIQKYLAYYLEIADKKEIISGTAQPQITCNNMRDFKIPLCDISEQERIVARIEELFSQLNSGMETLNTIKQQLTVYRQAVLHHVFSVCGTIKANTVCQHISDGDHMPPPKTSSGIPFIMISNIRNNKINWNNTSFVGEDYYNAISEKRTPHRGDVLYTVTGSYGIPVKVNFDNSFCFQRHIAILRPNELISQDFLYYALQTPSVFQQVSKRATGTAQKTIGLTVLRDINIPYISSRNEQDKLIREIETRLSVCDNIENTVEITMQQTEALRQSILKKAFEGRLI